MMRFVFFIDDYLWDHSTPFPENMLRRRAGGKQKIRSIRTEQFTHTLRFTNWIANPLCRQKSWQPQDIPRLKQIAKRGWNFCRHPAREIQFRFNSYPSGLQVAYI